MADTEVITMLETVTLVLVHPVVLGGLIAAVYIGRAVREVLR